MRYQLRHIQSWQKPDAKIIKFSKSRTFRQKDYQKPSVKQIPAPKASEAGRDYGGDILLGERDIGLVKSLVFRYMASHFADAAVVDAEL